MFPDSWGPTEHQGRGKGTLFPLSKKKEGRRGEREFLELTSALFIFTILLKAEL